MLTHTSLPFSPESWLLSIHQHTTGSRRICTRTKGRGEWSGSTQRGTYCGCGGWAQVIREGVPEEMRFQLRPRQGLNNRSEPGKGKGEEKPRKSRTRKFLQAVVQRDRGGKEQNEAVEDKRFNLTLRAMRGYPWALSRWGQGYEWVQSQSDGI